MDFIAIDFETATRRADSACQLAAVQVKDGQIVDEKAWLIRPRPFSFDAHNIAIHGIRPQDVQHEREFGDLWPEIQEALRPACLMAHNASFDMGVLLACLGSHGHPAPELQYSCTRAIGRRAWPHLGRYGLKRLADFLGIRFRHHDALEDSRTCARIALAAAEDAGVSSLSELESKLRLSRGRAGAWGKQGPRYGANSKRRPRAEMSLSVESPSHFAEADIFSADDEPDDGDLQRLLIRAEFIRPLEGQSIVFTGILRRMPRDDAEQLAERCGATCRQSVSRKTDWVVVGDPDERTRRSGRNRSVKEEKAIRLAEEGHSVRIVSESDFLRLLVAPEPMGDS